VLLPVLKRIIPEGQNKFVDVFGGGGSVSLSGKYAPIQIYNDYNQHLTNFYTIIKTRCRDLVNAFAGAFGKDGKFVEEIEQRIFANIRDQFNACCLVFYRADTFEEFYDSILKMLNKAGSIQDKQHVWMNSMLAWELYKKREKDPELFDALMFLILMKCSFSATGKSWAWKGTNAETAIHLINDASRVFQHIAVDNRDCLDIIRLHDSPTTIFYCDPPYYMAEKCYSGVPLFGDMMHKALHDALLKCKAKVIISYNECDFIDELYS
jgi:DNA adenine methylase